MNHVHLIVTCAGAVFALPIEQVIEVVQMVALASRLPRAPRYCLGAIDYHGRLVPLIELGSRLGLCAPHPVEELVDSRVVLIEERSGHSERLLGYVVDGVSELSDRPPSPLDADGQRFGGLFTGTVRWQEKRNALVLDLRPGVILPVRAGLELRRALLELQPAAEAAGLPTAQGLGNR